MKSMTAVLSDDEGVDLGVFPSEDAALEAARDALEDGLQVREDDALELIPATRVRRFIITDTGTEAVWIGRRPRRRPGRLARRPAPALEVPAEVGEKKPGLITRLFGRD